MSESVCENSAKNAAPIVFDFSTVSKPIQVIDTVTEKREDLKAEEEESEESVADDVAKKLLAMLVGAFQAKEGRDPTAVEIEAMMGELTEERIAAMMEGREAPAAAVDVDGEEVGDEAGEGEGEEEGEGEGEEESADEEINLPENADIVVSGTKRDADTAGLPSGPEADEV